MLQCLTYQEFET
ncbi:hypothetical protein FOXB_11155 [Fusarium oxysporum f. sp. conglutinans Fo5176]|uniref:Uncharacterized protein n=1 Tax=Fusarium oxysporum (strain Fo5176) TaxID=660025 RepID=F9FXM3_FUSOF|nr:hypothetical protein FOXB_11155 [Fusarium oxysporum f. sp. conglutinans Fo5176]